MRYLLSTTLLGLMSNFLLAQLINPGIILTFDDNAVSNWHELIPVINKHNAKATFYVCNPHSLNQSQRTQLKELESEGNEIGSHSYNHLNALHFTDTSSISNYINTEIIPSIHWFDSVLNIPIKSFAYPFGARNASIDYKLFEYFNTIRGTSYSVSSSSNKIFNLSKSRLIYGIGIDASYHNSYEEITNELDRCITDSLIQVFYAHKPVDSITGPYQVTYTFIDSILNYARKIGLNFYTSSQAYLPIPMKPSGDTLVFEGITKSTYYSNAQNYELIWDLAPKDCGTIIQHDSVAEISWHTDMIEECQLKVAHKNECGTGTFSEKLKIQFKYISAIKTSDEDTIRIYTNRDEIHIATIMNEKFKLSVFNILGQKIKQLNSSQHTNYIIGNLEKGTYLVILWTPNRRYSKLVHI